MQRERAADVRTSKLRPSTEVTALWRRSGDRRALRTLELLAMELRTKDSGLSVGRKLGELSAGDLPQPDLWTADDAHRWFGRFPSRWITSELPVIRAQSQIPCSRSGGGLRQRTSQVSQRLRSPRIRHSEGLWRQCLPSAGLFELLAPLLSVIFSGMPQGRPDQLIPSARRGKVMMFSDPTPATTDRLEAPRSFCSTLREKCGRGCDFFSAGANNRVTADVATPADAT